MTAARGFPAFPPRPRRRGRSWWARAFVAAMEDAALDSGLLRRGRRFAGSGRVGPISVSPGRIAAVVEDPDGIFDATVALTELSDAGWDGFLDQVAAEAGHLAALLEGDVPQSLVRSADAAGVPLLPTIGDLESDCDCPDIGDPCQHAAALCYQAAWLLDDDPFVLLLLRGRSREDLLDALGDRVPRGSLAAASLDARAAGDGPVLATDAYAADVPAVPDPGASPRLGGAPELPVAPGMEPETLALLVADAAARARALLDDPAEAREGWPAELRPDAARWAANHPELTQRLAAATGPGLAPAAQAWSTGGAAGWETLERLLRGDPPTPEEAAAVAPPEETPDGETGTDTAVRRGPDGRWYAFRRTGRTWWPAGWPDRDLDTARDDLSG